MGGETEANESGWSTDTLHQHMQSQINGLQVLLQTEMAAKRLHHSESIANLKVLLESRTEAVQVLMQRQLDDQRMMLDERYATSVKALDAAFASQQVAMRTALEAAEKAVTVALLSAEKAVTKAETAAEKRFEAVNEFRAQLTDQAATFPSRIEVDTRLVALSDKLDSAAMGLAEKVESRTASNTLRLNELTARFDILRGSADGKRDGRDASKQTSAIIIAGLGLLVAIIVAAFGIYAATGK